MTVTIYRSTDSSAPVLTGLAGTLITLLDACLVNGYTGHPSLGWTKAFAGTNRASYKQPAGSNGFYLDVTDLDNAPRLRAYETMTAVNAGTNPTPSDSQLAGGTFLNKSQSADAVVRPWILISNGKIFYLFVDSTGGNFIHGQMLAFGDFISNKVGDAYNTIILSAASSGYTAGHCALINSASNSPNAAQCILRSHTQIGSSIASGKITDNALGGITLGQGITPYPNPIDGGLHLGSLRITETVQAVVRGIFPGLWAPLHPRPLAVGDTFSGSGELAGKTFESMGLYPTSQFAFETSNTW